MSTDGKTPLEAILESRFGSILAEIAMDYLNWPDRVDRMEATGIGALSDSQRPFPDASQSEAFRDYLSDRYENLRDEDFRTSLELLFEACPRLTDWIGIILKACPVPLEIEDYQPRISVRYAKGWVWLTDRFDPDALVCYELARRGYWKPDEELKNWGVSTLIGDHDLGVHLSDGVADLHVHLWGLRNGQVFWRNILTRRVALQHVRLFEPGAVDKLRGEKRRERILQRDRIAGLIDDIQKPSTLLGGFWAGAVPSPPADPTCERSRLRDALLRERGMMAHVWKKLHAWKSEGATTDGSTARLEREFDRYLFTKNTFLSNHVQPSVTTPGLDAFRRFFHASERVTPRRRRRRPIVKSARVWARELGEFGEYLDQSSALRKVELRTGPLPSLQAYQRLFRAWDMVEQDFKLAEKGIDIRFAVHFKRSLDKAKKDKPDLASEDPAEPIRKLLMGLDRDSAVLHQYLRHPSAQAHAWRISRLDFAGAERQCPSDLAALSINLVRGDPGALEEFGKGHCDDRIHRNWLYLVSQGLAKQRYENPIVGVTCHAGEDYAHPLEGIYSVASAVKNYKMRAGDTIGHGLALGEDIARFDAARHKDRLTQRGNRWDAALWLYSECMHEGPDELRARSSTLENWLRDEARYLYGAPIVDGLSTLALRKILDERTNPVPSDGASTADIFKKMHRMELFDRGCSSSRLEPAYMDKEIREQIDLVKWVQERVRNQVAESGIILEFNPSSNLRIAGEGSLDETPFMFMLREIETNVLATLNTDNPGVFGTRIENEYALVMRALLDAEIPRATALRILERLREIGERFVSWPSHGRPPAENAHSGIHGTPL